MSKAVRILAFVLGLLVLAALGFVAFAWRSAIAPISPPPPVEFAAASVRLGADLAALGDCGTCHTAAGGRFLAGGRAVPTPLGTIFSTNITPDPATGIGTWSQEAFRRAMREGVNREGRHLYPAFPYDHFTLVSDADDAALYAYLMTREPVRATAPANRLPFPLQLRPILALWKALYLKPGPFRADPSHDERWNRGAYLATGLGHCGACHTPRNALGAEQPDHQFDGGDAEHWHADAINARSSAPIAWDATALRDYLRTGWHALHGDALGPMASVVQNLGAVPDADVQAIAIYVASTMGRPGSVRSERDSAAQSEPVSRSSTSSDPGPGDHEASSDVAFRTAPDGAAIYRSTCANCHDGSRPLPFGGIRLHLSTSVAGDRPTNFLNIVLYGLRPVDGTGGPIMPGFASALSDEQLQALVTYVRVQLGRRAAWTELAHQEHEARSRFQ